MFDFLKKKIKEFVGGVVGKEEEKPPVPADAVPKLQDLATVPLPENEPFAPVDEPETQSVETESKPSDSSPAQPPSVESSDASSSHSAKAPLEVPLTEPVSPAPESSAPQVPSLHAAVVEEERRERREKPQTEEEKIAAAVEAVETRVEARVAFPSSVTAELEPEEEEIEELVGGTEEGRIKKEAAAVGRKIVEEKVKQDVARTVFTEKKAEAFLVDDKERDLKPKVGLFSQLKGVFTGGVTITDSEVAPLFADLELALLESDVSFDTAQALIENLKPRLVGKRVPRQSIEAEVKKEIAFVLASMMRAPAQDLAARIREAKSAGNAPYIVLFLGPNGAGKTTTIAKVAHSLKQQGLSCVISASDTFRAAAIEQAEFHGAKLGIKVVRHKYGADPAAVAFDAIAHAKSANLDAVLIDTAGRQDTNRNLLSEMEKIVRITKPNAKLFVAEAIAGTTLVGQVKTFHEKLSLDGIILTKLDCDAKGGGSLSIAYECHLPVFYVGVGQEYDDLKPFNESWIVRNILAE